jgi:broad specificity phosphatase PhoE
MALRGALLGGGASGVESLCGIERGLRHNCAMDATLPKLFLVRHGETAWSLGGKHTGLTDIALTERGERDARALLPPLAKLQPRLVLTSPLQRAARTATLAGFSDAVRDDDLLEWDYGAYEGRTTLAIQTERPAWRQFIDGCPGGESLAAVSVRADRVVARVRAVRGDALLFAHRDILRVVIARWIALPADEGCRMHLATASVSTLGYDHDLSEPMILKLNETHDTRAS